MSDETIRYVFQDSANIIRGYGQPGYAVNTSVDREAMLHRHATELRANAARRGIDYNHDLEVIHTNVQLAMPNAPSPVKRAMARVMMIVRLRTGMPDAHRVALMYEHLRTDPQYGPTTDQPPRPVGLSGRARQDPDRHTGLDFSDSGLTRQQAIQQYAETVRQEAAADQPVQLENGVTLEDLFRGAGPNRAHSTRSDFHRNLRENGGLEGDRQREAGAARAITRAGYAPEQVQSYRIAWESPDIWITPTYTYQINQMEDQHLWETLHWIMTNMHAIFQEYGVRRSDVPAALQAKHWLRNQTAFRSMIQEALRRGLTFQRDHFVYLRDYVVRHDPDRGEVLQETQPWRNPAMAYQRDALAGFLNEPTSVPEPEDYGKEFRSIDIDP